MATNLYAKFVKGWQVRGEGDLGFELGVFFCWYCLSKSNLTSGTRVDNFGLSEGRDLVWVFLFCLRHRVCVASNSNMQITFHIEGLGSELAPRVATSFRGFGARGSSSRVGVARAGFPPWGIGSPHRRSPLGKGRHIDCFKPQVRHAVGCRLLSRHQRWLVGIAPHPTRNCERQTPEYLEL